MSRHVFTGLRSATSVAIGWDRPLETFFVQVLAPHPEMEGEDEILFWRGTERLLLNAIAYAPALD